MKNMQKALLLFSPYQLAPEEIDQDQTFLELSKKNLDLQVCPNLLIVINYKRLIFFLFRIGTFFIFCNISSKFIYF